MAGAPTCVNGHPLSEQDQTCPVCGTMPMGEGFTLLPTPALPTIPGYEVGAEVGQGGMGVVYKARHQKLERWVAIKMIRNWSFAGAEEQARFRNEAQAIARLQHAGIVQIFDIGDWQGVPFLALEFIEGGTLQTKLARQPMAPLDAARLLRKIVEPMVYAHQQGIVHRDLKPANVLLTLAGEPKITDFGLAKRLDAGTSITRPDAILGTPCYMAPEQAKRQNRSVGPPADVYALGVILYEMLTGRPPFLGESALDTIQQVLNEEPVSPRRLHSRVPRDLETICLKCLHKDPARRYADAAELAEDLAAFEAGKRIKGRPVSRLEIAWRWCVQNPLPASLLSLLLVVFLTGFGLVFWQWQDAEWEKREKETALENLQQTREREKNEEKGRLDALKKAEAATQAKQSALDQLGKEIAARQEAVNDREFAHRKAGALLKERDEAQQMREKASRWQSAVKAWDEGNANLAEQDLMNVPARLRRWEWHFLHGRLRSTQIARFDQAPTARPFAAYSPDGKWLAVAGLDGALDLRDARNHALVKTLKGHVKQVNCLAFNADGSLLAAGDDSNAILLWDLNKPEQPRHKLADLPGRITCVAFSPNGKLFAFGWASGYAVRSVAAPTEQDKTLYWYAERSDYANVAFSPDNKHVVTGRRDGDVEFRNFLAPRVRDLLSDYGARTKAHRSNCAAVLYSKDGKQIFTGGADGLVKVWDAVEWTWRRTHEGNLGLITALTISPDGALLASASLESMIRIWDLNTGTERAILRGHASAVSSLSFAVAQPHLASAAYDDTLRIWNLDAVEGAAGVHINRKGYVYYSLAADRRRLFVAETLPKRVWSVDLTHKEPFAEKSELKLELNEVVSIQHVAVSGNGKYLALADNTAALIHVWDLEAKEKRASLDADATSILQVQFRPSHAEEIVGVDKLGRVKVWNLNDPGKSRLIEGPNAGKAKAEVQSFALSPDGRWLATGRKSNGIRVWDLAKPDGAATAEFKTAGGVQCLAFSPDSEDLAFWAGKDALSAAAIQVVAWKNLKLKIELAGHRHYVHSLAFHPEGGRLISVGADDLLRVWDLATGDELMRWKSFDRHTTDTRLAFSPDGRFAISSGFDAICLWDGTRRDER